MDAARSRTPTWPGFHPERPHLISSRAGGPDRDAEGRRAQPLAAERWRRTSQGRYVPVLRRRRARRAADRRGGERASGLRRGDRVGAAEVGRRSLVRRPGVGRSYAATRCPRDRLRGHPSAARDRRVGRAPRRGWTSSVHDGLRTTTSVRSLLFELPLRAHGRGRRGRDRHGGVLRPRLAARAGRVRVPARRVARHPQSATARPRVGRREQLVAPGDADALDLGVRGGTPSPARPTCRCSIATVGTSERRTSSTSGPASWASTTAPCTSPARAGSRDLGREDAFRSVGLEYFTMLASDAANQRALVSRMEAARRRALWLPRCASLDRGACRRGGCRP